MNDKKYRAAAKRHLETCEYMLDYLDQISYADSYSKENILVDIYYLSGYVIECIVSYAIGELELSQSKITETRKIHNFQNNDMYFLCRNKPELEMPIESLIKNSGVQDLYKYWNPKIRYDNMNNLRERDIKKIVELSKSIYQVINKEIR
ncbi:MAG: hypothetical protein KAI83_09635 [Thiomargarita sp.]|nr:hypothetical protein [Thiomargarita sp.]